MHIGKREDIGGVGLSSARVFSCYCKSNSYLKRQHDIMNETMMQKLATLNGVDWPMEPGDADFVSNSHTTVL